MGAQDYPPARRGSGLASQYSFSPRCGFAQLFRLNMRLGWRPLPFCLLAVLVVALTQLLFTSADFSLYELDESTMTLGDALAIILGGKPPFEFRPGIIYHPPLGWTLLLALALFPSLAYPHRSLRGFGKTILIAAGSRTAWWGAMVLWTVLTALLVWPTICLAALCWALARGWSLSICATSVPLVALGVSADSVLAESTSMLPFMCSSLLSLLAMVVLQLFLSLAFSPIVAYLVSLVQLVSSAYLQTPFLLGNALTFTRWGPAVSGGVDPDALIGVSVLVIALSLAGSLVYAKRSDLQEKG